MNNDLALRRKPSLAVLCPELPNGDLASTGSAHIKLAVEANQFHSSLWAES